VSRAVRALLLVVSLFAGVAGYVGCAPMAAPALAPASYRVEADDDPYPVIDVAWQQGIHPSRGFDLILDNSGSML